MFSSLLEATEMELSTVSMLQKSVDIVVLSLEDEVVEVRELK